MRSCVEWLRGWLAIATVDGVRHTIERELDTFRLANVQTGMTLVHRKQLRLEHIRAVEQQEDHAREAWDRALRTKAK